MKVLHLGKYYPPVFGGIENVNYTLVEGLNKNGVHADVLCFNNESVTFEERVNDYKVYRSGKLFDLFSMPISFSYIFSFRKLMNDYDIISIHCPNPVAFLCIFLFRPKAKVVLHWHSDIVKQKKVLFLFKWLQTFVINRASAVLGATPAHINQSDEYAKFSSKAHELPYVFSPSSFVDKLDIDSFSYLKKQYKGKKVIFAIGRHVYYKGFHVLIESARLLPENYIVLIAGDGPEYQSLKYGIESRGLIGKVELIGGIDLKVLPSYLKLCDVFCFPSTHRSEMFGIVQLEAMAFRKPIVATNISRSGVPYVNINGKTGINVEVNDDVALANAIIKLCENENLIPNFNSNVEEELAKYDEEKVISELINIYYKVFESE